MDDMVIGMLNDVFVVNVRQNDDCDEDCYFFSVYVIQIFGRVNVVLEKMLLNKIEKKIIRLGIQMKTKKKKTFVYVPGETERERDLVLRRTGEKLRERDLGGRDASRPYLSLYVFGCRSAITVRTSYR